MLPPGTGQRAHGPKTGTGMKHDGGRLACRDHRESLAISALLAFLDQRRQKAPAYAATDAVRTNVDRGLDAIAIAHARTVAMPEAVTEHSPPPIAYDEEGITRIHYIGDAARDFVLVRRFGFERRRTLEHIMC